MKTQGEVEEELHSFLTSTLPSNEWTAHPSGRFTAGDKAQSTHEVKAGGTVQPSEQIEKEKNSLLLPGHGARILCCQSPDLIISPNALSHLLVLECTHINF
jgi:hypothetical protein